MITLNSKNDFYVNVPNDATGTVEFRLSDETSPVSSQISSGGALISLVGSVGIYPEASIRYSGDSKYYPSEIRDLLVIWLVSSKNIKEGKTEKIDVRVPYQQAVDAGYPVFTGSVNVKINGVDYSAFIINGGAKVNIENLPAGNYNALVTYLPDTDDWPSFSTTTKFKVNSSNQ